MSSEKKIKRLFAKSDITVNSQIDDRIISDTLTVFDKSEKTHSVSPEPNIWKIIMKNPTIKLAAAAAMIIAVIIGIKGFNGTTAWAEVVKAIKNADNIHILSKITKADGLIIESHAWLKNRTMIYDEDPPDEITIDDGVNRLTLDTEKKTAQLSDSYSPFEDYMETGNFEIILLFRGEDTPFKATELSDESTSATRIYEVNYRDIWKGKAWVDAKSNLPVRIVAEITEKYKEHALSLEVIYDYKPIPVEKFSLTIPAGYTELPRLESQLFSGKVIYEQGKAVADAEICTPNKSLMGKTDEKGEFAIKLRPRSMLWGMPMIVRAFKSDIPDRVAWTILRNPRHELRPLFIPDDGKTKLEQGNSVNIHLVDEKKLTEFIPGEPPKMIFNNESDRHPSQIRDIVLKMGPASTIMGRITDRASKPIANAIVWIDRMVISVGENEIEIHDMGHTKKEKEIASSLNIDDIREKSFAVTDKNGYYSLTYLPDVWYRTRLEVKADGYVREAKEIFQEECDFSLLRADITIRGTVIDNHGTPLVGREVDLDMERDSDEERDFDIEEAIIDERGRFELTGVPEMDGLEIEIRTDEKPYDWDENELTRGRKFIYYLMIEKPIKFEPGKKDYQVEIVAHRPDITLEIEVKDSKGNFLEGIPVGICSPGFSERVWYISKLNGKTDKKGKCIIEEVPRIKPLNIWICKPTTRPDIWDIEREVNMEVKNAITAFNKKYHPTEVTVELEKEKKRYKIPITLQTMNK